MITCPNKNLPEWLELEQLVPDLKYTIWDLNNGNGIDKAPNGKESILFKSLLEYHNGNRNAAIQAKAKVYSSSFREWFGDWVNDDKTNVSKVVDENGEPLVVYHGSKSKINKFDISFFGKTDGGNSGIGFYFTPEERYAKTYGENVHPAFLNIKTPLITEGDINIEGLLFNSTVEQLKERFNEQLREYKQGFSEKEFIEAQTQIDKLLKQITPDIISRVNNSDGVINKSKGKIFEIVVKNPNQIKSIDNIGAFSTTDNNIYYQKGNIDFYMGMLEKRKELESSFEADNKLSDRMLQEQEDNGLLTYQEDRELFVNDGMRKHLEDKQEMLSNELYDHLRALYPEVELNFVEGLETAPDAKGMYFLPTMTIDIVLPLATMDTIPHEYAHHYIRMFIHTAIVLDAIKQFGSEEALVQAIGEQAVKQEGKAWGWWNQFISWLKEKFDINTKEDKERLKNLLTDAFLTRKNLNEVSYKANLDLRLRTQNKNIPELYSSFESLDTEEERNILSKAKRDNRGKLLAPNGKPTNLTEAQYVQVRTKAFKEWFGDWENPRQIEKKVTTGLEVSYNQNWVDGSTVVKRGNSYFYTNDDGMNVEITKNEFDDFNEGKTVILNKKTKVIKELDTNFSKILDENGEPLVMYHRSDTDIKVFDISKSRHGGFWFSKNPDYYENTKAKLPYAIPVFLNIRTPNIVNHETFLAAIDGDATIEGGIITTKFDGWITLDEHTPEFYGDEYSSSIVFAMATNPNQIKSIDNIGAFSTTDNNIYYQKLEKSSVSFQNTGSNILKPGDIVFGHPSIGKTYSLKHGKYKDRIIDWDVEFNSKRDKWIEEHSNTKKGTEEYKKARNEYLIYPEKYPDYVEFITTEWNRVKLKARTENKILFASPHNLLKMFPLDFNRIINIEDEDFIKRNVNRGGGEKESRLWKEGINNTISNITNIPIDLLTEDQHFEDYLDKYLGTSEKTDEKSGPFQNIDKLSKVYEKIITGLRGRLASLNRRSTLKDLNTLNELSNVIDLLATLEAKDGVIAFIDHVNDTINISKLFLSKKTSDINSKLLILLKRDYLGFYTPMVKSLKDILDTTELLNDIPEAEEFKSTVDNLLLTLETLNNKYNLILETKTKEFVIEYATDAGSPFVNDLVEWLDNPSNDISFLGYFVGLSSSTNNEMIRIMENIIRNQKNITDMETLYEGKNIIALLNEAKKSYGGDIMSALLEFNKNGKRTGYFVRDRNYGMFHDALSKELERLALKYNLLKGSDGKYILPEDTVELRRYTKELNKWYAKHADRRYVPEYYEHKNRILSLATIEAQSNIQKRINLITSNITRDGIVREDLLTDSQLDELDRLYAERKNLSNLYNFDGSRKTGEDLDIALELREFNELVNENVKYKTDYDKFNKARDLMIEKYGKDSPEFKKWISRNNVLVYTDEFWKLLDKLQAPTFATKEDLELHDELVGRRRELHKLYRKRNSLEIDVTKLNEDEILMLRELDIKIASLRQYVKVDDDSLTFNDVAKIVNTKEYFKVYQQKQQEAQAKNDPSIFTDWYEANHYEDRRGKMHPVSVWTYIQPVNDAHITYQPSSKWSEPDLSNSSWINKDYEVNSEEAILPKKALYDNSDAFNKIKNNKEAFALYNALLNSMDKSLSKLSFLTHSNKYRLPQMTARTMLMVGRESNIFKGLGYMIKDEFTIKDDDKDYVPTFDRRPDGSLIKLIPTKYLKPLDNPSMISADTVGSVIEFFNMAENYKLMSKVKDDLEMLLDRMSLLEYNKDNKFKAAGTLNVFKKAESLLDMHLYGKRKNQVEATILGKKINITKALSKIYGVAGTINLAFNMWAMATNAITGKGYTVMESTLGRYFNKQDFAWAEKNYYTSLPNIMANLGNPNDTTKLMFMCQLNQVARSNQETFSNLDLSPVLRAINQHFWYNGYTAGDFAVKSTILGAVYHSYRLVTTPDGTKQFMTREDYVSKYYANAPLTGRTKFDEFDVTLYDVYELDKNTYKVKDEYRQYVTVNLTNMVKNKIQTISARIDGNINDTDRAAIHANAYALFLVMHRNFMIVGLQDRFKKTQFNYNTGAVEEGIYRSIPKLFDGAFSDGMFNVIHNMILNYHNMKDYEQYAVRKVITELGTILGVSLLVSLLLVPLADDTDDDWALEALTYVAMRTAFEFRTLYQPLELTALLNSPSAAFSSITNAAEMLKLIWIPNYFSDNSSPFKLVSTGAYKGMPKLLRNFIKVTPFKNVIEASDPKAKRKYLDNQLAF